MTVLLGSLLKLDSGLYLQMEWQTDGSWSGIGT